MTYPSQAALGSLAELEIVSSARVVHGVHTNTIVKKRKPKRAKPPKPPRQPPAPRKSRKPTKGRYKRDLSVRGKPYRQACISFPKEELAALDAVALRVQMSRSTFLRQAAKHFTAWLFP